MAIKKFCWDHFAIRTVSTFAHIYNVAF